MYDSLTSRILNGVEQGDRLLPALEEGYFNVDEMSFEDLLTVSVEFASSLTYFNSNLQPSGDWGSFLASNEIVIMANIINNDVDGLRKRVQSSHNQGVSELQAIVFGVIFELDKWLSDLKNSDSSPANDLASEIESIVRSSLRKELHNIAALTEQAENEEGVSDVDYQKLNPVWEVSGSREQGFHFPRQTLVDHNDDLSLIHQLRRVAFEFFNAIEHLKSICKKLLPQSLTTQSHDPAISLFITFLKLYRYAQDNANSFTQRHLDYYYHEILKVQSHEKQVESVVLNFSVLPGSKPVEIDSGQKFTCARDADFKDVVFNTRQSLTVNDAEVAELYTLNFQREKMITPECDMNFVTKIHKQKIPLLAEKKSQDEQAWPLFGNNAMHSLSGLDDGGSLEVGIAVASKVLFLDEGYRRVRLDVSLSKSIKPISFYLEALQRSANRAEFREAIFQFMLGWMNNPQLTDWAQAVPKEISNDIGKTAATIDVKNPPIMMSAVTGNSMQVESCVSMLESAIAQVQSSSDISLPYYSHLRNAESQQEFKDRLGELVIHCLLETGSPEKLMDDAIKDRAQGLRCWESLKSVVRELEIGRDRLFKKYFNSAFVIELSTEAGWLEIDRYDVIDKSLKGIGLQITASLPTEAPPIVSCLPDIHGDQWSTELPVMKLKINPEAAINVYSLMEAYCIDTVTVGANVIGARNIVAFNNISQLDPSKPFYPFGPMPTTSSYLALSVPEAAKKDIDSFQIHLHWGDLPKDEEGFDGHYGGYRSTIKNNSFAANVNILSNGNWQPRSSSQIQSTSLFTIVDKKPQEHQVIDIDSVEHFKPVNINSASDELDLGLKTRNGFVKLTLTSPDAAFGHSEYPQQLSQTLESNAKARPKKKKNLPNAPYTPLLNKISIDYTASSTLSMSAPGGARTDQHSETVYRMHPFGTETVYPNQRGGSVPFFKPFDHDGNLLLGISATELPEVLNLYFSLSDDSERSRSDDNIRHQWSYLTNEGWVNLREEQIVSDGTKGFLCSGIITLEIPEDIPNEHTDMPGACFWLRVSSNAGSGNFCSLKNVKTHAVELLRSADDLAEFDARDSQWSTLQWEPLTSIPGLEPARQLDGFFNIGKAEDRRHLITRVNERIRHRSRAITPWDYERLILERFPFVGKVLCLPNCSKYSTKPAPGNLLIVVTPIVSVPDEVVGITPKLSAVFLNDIHDYVKGLSSAFTHIEVTNPTFEWVQIRCAAVFEKHASGGLFIEQLNRDINQYLNPWEETGYGLNYCQTINRDDIYSHIYNLDYIKYVTEFSMLHITVDNEGSYQLADTVNKEAAPQDGMSLEPHTPWSLIVPLKRHYIDVNQVVEPKEPEATGIRQLEIGSTFIIGGI